MSQHKIAQHKIAQHGPLMRRLLAQAADSGRQPLSRRVFLKVSGVGGLALGFACSSDETNPVTSEPTAPATTSGEPGPGQVPNTESPGLSPAADACEAQAAQSADPVPAVDVNAFVRIGADDSITLFSMKSDMGQGVLTALAMLLAEELDVAWEKVHAEHPVTTAGKYALGGGGFGGINQLTVGSTSISQMFTPMRQMGAAAREMLIGAAAQTWGVAANTCTTELGEVVHAATGRRLKYSEVAELAATLPAPQNPALKTPANFRLIGTPRSQLNARAKAGGTAQYTLDVNVPDMLVGLVARAPSIGDTLASFDDRAALQVPGVRQVVQIPSGVAVLADHFWAALKGREALTVEWQPGPNASLDTARLATTMAGMLATGQEQLQGAGGQDPLDVITASTRSLDVQYDLPYLAHAPMEPLNALAHVKADGTAEIWAGTQGPDQVATAVGQLLGVAATNVTVHVPLLGGAFGRRAVNDYVIEAVEASRAAGNLPVKIVYTREDDMRAAQYRPINCSRMRASLGADGLPNAWIHNIVVPGIFGAFFAVEGSATNFPYAIDARSVTWADPQVAVPVFTWRSVGASHNAFVVESFLDELATLAGSDALAMRLALLARSTDPAAPRFARALQEVATRSGWANTPPEGRARGIAVHQTFGTIVAEVAEVSVEAGQVRVHKVWAAVDCGRVVNPRGVMAQCEGAIVFGISAALYGQIDIESGRPVQGNFDTYQLLRFREAPEIEVTLVDSASDAAPITGMGEPGVPPIAPAIASALFKLTGERVRRLPIALQS